MRIFKTEPPYYARYPLYLILWKPIRKYINVVIIPNIPFAIIRVFLYRCIGFNIGKKVFIGMKCYLDDVDPEKTVIEDNVIISYGCYFACHGKAQEHSKITIKQYSYVGMRCNIISGRSGIVIGEHSIIGAGSLVNVDVEKKSTVAGVPIKILRQKSGNIE